jgi:hypothetical protein
MKRTTFSTFIEIKTLGLHKMKTQIEKGGEVGKREMKKGKVGFLLETLC